LPCCSKKEKRNDDAIPPARALREIFDQWQQHLQALDPAVISTQPVTGFWTTKDVVAHLAAWQELSNARLDAALANREPVLPAWMTRAEVDHSENVDDINAVIYASIKDDPWEQVVARWHAGFEHLLQTAAQLDERTLLDGDRFAWMHGYSMADVLLGTYDHHVEHWGNL
jgi:hypothetical protein